MKSRCLLSAMIAAVLFLFTGLQSSEAQSSGGMPRLEADPQARLFAEGLDSADWRSLFGLAYWVSGAAGDSEAALKDFEPAVTEVISAVASFDERRKAEKVLEYMHRRFLRTYFVGQTRFDTLLATGGYNCVSSALLYAILGTAAGLRVSGVSTADHAFCSVSAGGEQIDVETTSLYGFEPGTKTEFSDAFGKTTGYAYIPPGNYRDRRPLDLIGLFSLVLTNRISDAESAGDFTGAVGLAADRWALLGGGTGEAYEQLVDRMVNYGVSLTGTGREEAALAWAEEARAVYGPHEKWVGFIDSTANNLIVRLLRAGRTEDARRFLETLKPGLSIDAGSNLDLIVSDAELLAALKAVEAGGDESLFYQALESAARALPPERIREVEESWLLKKIDGIAKTEGWEAAYRAAEQAIALSGTSRRLEDARRISLKNHTAGLYNRAVSAFNAGRYQEAYDLTIAALREFPDERIFIPLLEGIEQALGADR